MKLRISLKGNLIGVLGKQLDRGWIRQKLDIDFGYINWFFFLFILKRRFFLVSDYFLGRLNIVRNLQ